MTIVVGLTGGIATGKSTVSSILSAKGIPIIDADDIAKRVVEPNQPAYQQIVKIFGHTILQADGQIDRKLLGNIVFSDSSKREQLNQAVHPYVKEMMLKQRDQYMVEQQPIIVLDIPLLFESHLQDLVDLVVVVYTTPENQLNRLMKRNQLTKEEAQSRIEAQMPIDQKAGLADVLINNNDTLMSTKQQCEKLVHDLVHTSHA